MNKTSHYSNLSILPSGYGHWKITTIFRNKEYSTVTSNSQAIDDYKSEDGERDGRELRTKRGYNALRNEIMSANFLR